MKITVEDRRAVSAEASIEMVKSYLERTGWALIVSIRMDRTRVDSLERGDSIVLLPHGIVEHDISRIIEDVAQEERRQPSAVLSDIVGYQVGLDRGRASVLRNSASARVVEAREALARVKPHNVVEHERARVRLAQAEADLAAATRALEAAEAAETR